jgi:GntR family transcriptional regulator
MTRYREIAADLRRRILQGEFPVGARMPSEQRLAAEYGVSRGVVRNALASLQRRGMVAAQAGSGWRAGGGAQLIDFTELRSFAQWASSRGLHSEGLVIGQSRRHPTTIEARELRLGTREEVLDVTRLRTLGGRSVMVERGVFAPHVLHVVEALPPDTPSVTQALEDAGVRTVYGTYRIDTVLASAEDADLLGVRRATRLLRAQRVTFAPDGRPIERGDDRYAPDSVSFAMDAAGPSGATRVRRMADEGTSGDR